MFSEACVILSTGEGVGRPLWTETPSGQRPPPGRGRLWTKPTLDRNPVWTETLIQTETLIETETPSRQRPPSGQTPTAVGTHPTGKHLL